MNKIKIMKKWAINNRLNILSIIVLTLLLTFSIEFYVKIHWILMVTVVTLEVTTWLYVPIIKIDKSKNKYILILIIIVSMLISIFGFVSNGINIVSNTDKSQYKTIENKEYTKYTNSKKMLENDLNRYLKDKENYISFDDYLDKLNSPSWEDKTEILKSYNNRKKEIENNIKEKTNELEQLKEPDKTLKIKVEDKGFSSSLNVVSNFLGLKKGQFIFGLFLVMGILLQLIIYTSRIINVKVLSIVSTPNKKVSTVSTDEKVSTKVSTPNEKVSTVSLSKTQKSRPDLKLVSTPNKKVSTPNKKVSTSSKKVSTSNKKVSTVSTDEIVKYIIENYKSGDIIKVSTLMRENGLTKRKWDNLKKELDIIEVVGTKTKRI